MIFFLLSGSYGRPPRQPQQAAPAPISPADPWQVGSPANMASIKDLQVIVEFIDGYLTKIVTCKKSSNILCHEANINA